MKEGGREVGRGAHWWLLGVNYDSRASKKVNKGENEAARPPPRAWKPTAANLEREKKALLLSSLHFTSLSLNLSLSPPGRRMLV